jgi:cytochrome c553
MMRASRGCFVLPALLSTFLAAAVAGEPSPERGRAALLEQIHLDPVWPLEAYDNAWTQWGVDEKPADYEAAFCARYGLHPAPYENDGLPMGLRRIERLGRSRLATDCMLCHGGSVAGKSYLGMPNTTLDLPLLIEELDRASGTPSVPLPFEVTRSRGTVNSTATTAFIFAFRNPDLSYRVPLALAAIEWDTMTDMDVPAWWLWRRKATLYADGSISAESTRSMMVALAGSLVLPQQIKDAEPTWRDIRAYLYTLDPPKYPFAVDAARAAAGKVVFEKTCARCHGKYGREGRYPNRIVELDVIGTDSARYFTNTAVGREYYNSSWFGEKHPVSETVGYQAPPLEGVWATAPYLHNGSVPTVYAMLNSAARPTRFRRLPTTGAGTYDQEELGWKVEVLDEVPSADLPPIERRKIFDTTVFGKSNAGHTFGDHLSDEERSQVIEYLKTL